MKKQWSELAWHDKYFLTIIGVTMWIIGLIGILISNEFISFNAVMLFMAGTILCIFDAVENPNLK